MPLGINQNYIVIYPDYADPYNTSNFETLGDGVLPLAKSITVTQELDGVYMAEFTYPVDQNNSYLLIKPFKIIRIPGAENQIFRIVTVEYELNEIYVTAQHITYDLENNLCRTITVNSSTTFQNVLDQMKNASNLAFPHSNFSYVNNVSNRPPNVNYVYTNQNPISLLFNGTQDAPSIISLFKAKVTRDNYTLTFTNYSSPTTGVEVRFKKNIQNFYITNDYTTIYTRILPISGDGNYISDTLSQQYVDSPDISDYPTPIVLVKEYTDIVVDPNASPPVTLSDVRNLLRQNADDLFYKDLIDWPNTNIKIDFIDLSQAEEYQAISELEKVRIGDKVFVVIDYLDLFYKVTVQRIQSNILDPLSSKIELSSYRPNLFDTLGAVNQNMSAVNSRLQKL